MNKSLLNTFIRKYHLGGKTPVESVLWNIENNVLSTRFMTDDQSVLGEVTLKRFEFQNVELGVYITSQLQKMLNVLEQEINISLESRGEKVTSVQFSDGVTKMNYMLSEKSTIPKVPALKQEPDFDVRIPMNKDFIDRFISAKDALSEVETFTFLTEEGKGKIVVGYSSTINSNRISLKVASESNNEVSPISFSADYFKSILVSNRESDTAVLNISTDGLAKVEFDINDFVSTYYLVQIAN